MLTNWRQPTSRYLAFGLATVLGAAQGACEDTSAAPASEPAPVAVRVAPVERTQLRQSLEYVGTVRYRREIQVRAQLAGSLVDLPHAPGTAVDKGAVLARLAAGDVSARTRRVHYELERAKTESEYACDKYETDRRLVESGVITGAAADASRKTCEASRSSRRAARAQLSELSTMSSRTVERAASSVTVLDWLAEPGENVGPGQPLLLLGSGELEIEAKVPEEDVRQGLSTETPAEILLGRKWLETRIDRVAPIASGPSRSVEVRISIPEAVSGRLRAGAAVDVRVVLAESRSALTVPADAVGRADGKAFVFVIVGKQARRRAVETGLASGGRIELETPLDEGTRVAVAGLDQLRDGAPVFAVEQRR